MVNNSFTPEKLMQDLILMYAHLNDNNQKAEEVYNKIMSKKP
jgi:hypothetical protein